jgi:putative membrane protein
MMRYHDGGWGPGAWIAMAFVMVVFWGAVVTAIVFAVRGWHNQPTGSPGPTTSDAQRILDERFARGEIDADEYQHRRDLLRGK